MYFPHSSIRPLSTLWIGSFPRGDRYGSHASMNTFPPLAGSLVRPLDSKLAGIDNITVIVYETYRYVVYMLSCNEKHSVFRQ